MNGTQTGNRANVDDVPGLARLEFYRADRVSPPEERLEALRWRTFDEELGKGDKAKHVDGEHGFHVGI